MTEVFQSGRQKAINKYQTIPNIQCFKSQKTSKANASVESRILCFLIYLRFSCCYIVLLLIYLNRN